MTHNPNPDMPRRSRLTILLFFLMYFFVAVGQCQPATGSPSSIKQNSLQADNYEPGCFVLKLNARGEELFTPLTAGSSVFQGLDIEVLRIEPFFRGFIKSPRKNSNTPNIASIYKITYTGPLSVHEIVRKLDNSFYTDYAEPYYLDEVLVIPDDPAVQNGKDLFYLERYQAFDAWGESQGDTNIVIGIIDTGVRYKHEDLKDNLKYNIAEARGIPGVDDDNDGYIDNINGWDFGDNDNDPDAKGHEHGTIVAGISSATTNNGTGTAGTGYKCKYMPIKASADSLGGSIGYGYHALVYAAYQGCGVVNLSWGRTGSFSRMAQDIIDYVVLEYNVVVVAAAGNSGKNEAFYPASYNNVLSVASCDTIFSPEHNRHIDIKHTTATYHHTVDLCAQGRAIYSTSNNGSYSRTSGSSNAAPQVAGAAGLVRAKFPNLSALQVMERLRVTGDVIDTFPENSAYKEKIGRRLNMYKALTAQNIPSVRITASSLSNEHGNFVYSGDTVKLFISVTNYLAPTSPACKATLSSESPYVEILQDSYSPGSIPTMGKKNNHDNPFLLVLKSNPGTDLPLTFRIQFEDNDYYDYQYIEHTLNPSWITVRTEATGVTVSSTGRIGYVDNNSSIGDGFSFNDTPLLYEAGLVLAINDSTVSDCVREFDFIIKQDFKTLNSIQYIHSSVADLQTQSRFSDQNAKNPIGIDIVQNSYSWLTEDKSTFHIIEYNLTNTGEQTIDTLYAGIFADWDINESDQNMANWADRYKLGYVYDPKPDGLYAGISLLTNEAPAYFAMDHRRRLPGNINPNDGFTPREKFLCMKNGVSKTTAGGHPDSSDVSHLTGAIIHGLRPGETRKLAFAFHGSSSLEDLLKSAEKAVIQYRSFNTGPTPQTENYHFCLGDTVELTIRPGNGKRFSFRHEHYSSSDSILHLKNVYDPKTIFITNTDSLFESDTAVASIFFHEKPVPDFTVLPDVLNLKNQSFAEITSDNAPSLIHKWEIDDSVHDNTGTFIHHFYEPDTVVIKLTLTSEYGCSQSKSILYPVIYEILTSTPNVSGGNFSVFPVPAGEYIHLDFGADYKEKNIRILSATGTEVRAVTGQFKSKEINIQSLPSGTYLIIVTTGAAQYSRTFIKQ